LAWAACVSVRVCVRGSRKTHTNSLPPTRPPIRGPAIGDGRHGVTRQTLVRRTKRRDRDLVNVQFGLASSRPLGLDNPVDSRQVKSRQLGSSSDRRERRIFRDFKEIAHGMSVAMRLHMRPAMKIGIVTEYYYPTLGGIQDHIHHFAVAARRAGHEVRIITPDVHDQLASIGREASIDHEQDVLRIGESMPIFSGGGIARVSSGPGLSRKIADVLRAERFDILHAHSPLMPTLPFLALRHSDCANVGTFHSAFDRNFLYAALGRFIQPYLDRLDAAIGVSETALRGLRRYFKARWRVVPNGVDVSMFASGRRRPEFDDGRLNVLHVGRFDPRNGVDRVIKTWIGVRRGGADARLILVGDGPLRPTYESLVPADLRADAHFVGFVESSERPSYYASGDVLLCPALGGSFGIIALEAMAAGLAVITADTAGFRHIVKDGVQGFMVDVAADPDCVKLAERTRQLLEDQCLRKRCAEAGRANAARFDWPVVTERVLKIYSEILGGTGIRLPGCASV
jgi:phosphatidyl-myo-inositol alpha-mannosyltransferase